jgi:hypothetical protein
MKLNEFKAWINGFDTAINGSPTQEQWELIKKKLAEVKEYDSQIMSARTLTLEQGAPVLCQNT